MTRLILLLISIIGISCTAKADTIDYWHVYYNKIKIKEFNQYSNEALIIKVKDIKITDSLTILYFRDTPCYNCETKVTVETERHVVLTKGKGLGTFEPIKISVFDLVLKADRNYNSVFYQELNKTDPTQKILLFKVKLE